MQQDIIEKYKNHVVDPKTQQKLNEPAEDKTGFNEGHEDFIKILMGKLDDETLNPHTPDSLYNHEVYDKLEESEQDATGLTAVNILSLVRQLQQLRQMDEKPTFQIQHLVEQIWQMKSVFEEKHGDVFII